MSASAEHLPTTAPSVVHATISWLYLTASSLTADALRAALAERLARLPVDDDLARQSLDWHLHQAQTLCASRRNGQSDLGYARVSLTGDILTMDDTFSEFIHQAVPGWAGETLPFQIFWTDSLAYHGMTFARLFIRVRAEDNGYSLVVRQDKRANLLSRREQEVASLIADGQTFKTVGETLNLATSTVSTHLYRVYDKLGITSRSELVQWMREHHHAGPGQRNGNNQN